jgi:hypothetical protein
MNNNIHCYIRNGEIVNGSSVSKFLVVSLMGFNIEDWIMTKKGLACDEKYKNSQNNKADYEIRQAVKADVEKSIEAKVGKAMSLSKTDDIVTIDIYECDYGKPYAHARSYNIDRALYDAYILVAKNDQAVLEEKKASKAPENFTITLKNE